MTRLASYPFPSSPMIHPNIPVATRQIFSPFPISGLPSNVTPRAEPSSHPGLSQCPECYPAPGAFPKVHAMQGSKLTDHPPPHRTTSPSTHSTRNPTNSLSYHCYAALQSHATTVQHPRS